MDFATIQPMMGGAILMEAIVVYQTKIQLFVHIVFVMLKENKVLMFVKTRKKGAFFSPASGVILSP